MAWWVGGGACAMEERDSNSDEDCLHGWDEVLPNTLLNYDTSEYVVLTDNALLQGNRRTGVVHWLLLADGVEVVHSDLLGVYRTMKRSFLAK